MDSFEWNKIFGAILGTALFVVALNIVVGGYMAPHKSGKPGMEVVVAEAPTPGETPVVAHRWNHGPWLAILDLRTFLRLVADATGHPVPVAPLQDARWRVVSEDAPRSAPDAPAALPPVRAPRIRAAKALPRQSGPGECGTVGPSSPAEIAAALAEFGIGG